jgi:glycerophosphoryl diester phosphodiesterase
VSAAPSFADLRRPFVIAHRGGNLQAPENTLEAYRLAAAQGFPVELDVVRLGDGALGVMHDGTVDRMTTSSGNVSAQTAASWRELSIDAAVLFGGGWPDGLRPPLFDDVLVEFGDHALLVPEVKTRGAMGAVLDALERHGVEPGRVLLQSFALADCRVAVSRGWPVIWLGSRDVATTAAAGIGWIGVPFSVATRGLCTAAHAAGLQVAAFTVNRRYQCEPLVAAGVDAVFSGDPVYLTGGADRTTDEFGRGTWLPGFQANQHGGRGIFHADGSWGLELQGSARLFVLHGYLRPPNPAALTLDVDIAVDATHDDDPTGGASVYLGTTDHPFTGIDGAPHQQGHQFVVRRDGSLSIRRVEPGRAAVPLGELPARAAVPMPLGGFVPFRVGVTTTTLTLARRDRPAVQVTVADDAARGGYVSLGAARAGVRFREVRLT